MEVDQYLRFFVALVFVLALIALLSVIARKLGFGHATTMVRGQARRLAISEIMPLDARRKLVLVRRDDKEHLIVLGPNGETVVERDIDAPAPLPIPPNNPPSPNAHSEDGETVKETPS